SPRICIVSVVHSMTVRTRSTSDSGTESVLTAPTMSVSLAFTSSTTMSLTSSALGSGMSTSSARAGDIPSLCRPKLAVISGERLGHSERLRPLEPASQVPGGDDPDDGPSIEDHDAVVLVADELVEDPVHRLRSEEHTSEL